jgi:DNA-binding IclR family transcriptional regulator
MPAESRSRTRSTVAAVERAFAVLQTLSSAGESMGVSEIATETELAKSTVYRLLTTLEGLDMVGRAGDGRYRLGSGLALFTPAVRASLIDLARPI